MKCGVELESLLGFGEGGRAKRGRVGSASEASKKEPHPALPEDGKGKNFPRSR
jgi:hypothetical protein